LATSCRQSETSDKYLGITLAPVLENNVRGWSLVLLFILGIFFAILVYLAYRASSDLLIVTQFMNVAAVALAVMTLFQAAGTANFNRQLLQEAAQGAFELDTPFSQSPPNTSQVDSLPDIYYIILDGYGRADILLNDYQYSNAAFLDFLRQQGFYIAEQSHSNYSMTILSLSSSLNLSYLDKLATQMGSDSLNPAPLNFLIQNNGLTTYLHEQGYTTVAFATGFAPTELHQADLFLSPPVSLNGYQNELLNLTPLRIPLLNIQYDLHGQKIQFIFQQLPELAKPVGPIFAFVHILIPHPPFVFDAEGHPLHPDREFSLNDGSHFTSVAGRDEYVYNYRDQIIYVNQLVKETIRQLLSDPSRQTIILLQGDHGPGSMLDYESVEGSNIQERMSILNAYYFPDQNYILLYPEISPVNSFRVILSQYLQTPLELLEDRNYFSLMTRPYDFIDVTEQLKTLDGAGDCEKASSALLPRLVCNQPGSIAAFGQYQRPGHQPGFSSDPGRAHSGRLVGMGFTAPVQR
jgi:hypothetical protein